MRVLRGKGLELFFFALRHMAALVFKDEVRAADEDGFTVYHAGNAVRDDVLHLRVVFLVVQAPLLCGLHNGVCHRVRVVLLEARGQTQHIRFLIIGEGHDIGDLWHGVGECAGLVENDGVCVRNGHEPAALNRDMRRACLAHRRQNRNRHRKLERAREVDHQNGQHLCDISGQQIRQRRAAQRIGNELVGKAGGLVLGGRLEPFGLLDHLYDPVVPAAAHRLFHAEDALALFADRARIDEASFALDNRHGLSGHGRLVDHRLAFDHLAVERDEVARAHDDEVARLHRRDRNEHFRFARFDPDLIDIQCHRAREIGDGLLVRPLLEDLAEAQHEHDRARRIEIASHHRNGHRSRVQNGDRELSAEQRLEPLADILDRTEGRDDRPHGKRQKEFGKRTAKDGHGELVFVLAVECARRVRRDKVHRLRLLERKRGKRAKNGCAVFLEADHRVTRAVKDLNIQNARNIFQIILQNVCLMQRHMRAGQVHPHPPARLMQNLTFHIMESSGEQFKEIRAALCGPWGSLLFGRRCVLFRSVFHDSSLLRRQTRFVDVLGIGVDVLRALADGGSSLHDAVLRAKNGGGSVGVDLLSVLASENLQARGSEQNAGSKQTNMLHL